MKQYEQYNNIRMNAVRVVESLRAGVPTRISTRCLPDLRHHVTNSIRTDLLTFSEGRIPRGRMIWGQYGQGKTHALTTIEHIALDMGFAVSRVSLSREVSCHSLLQFYSHVAPRVRIPDSTIMGIERGLNSVSATTLTDSPIAETGRYSHPLPALVLENFFHTSGEEQTLLYGDLTGIKLPLTEVKRIHRMARKDSFPKIPPFRVGEHATSYFGMMADAIRLCGYKGWVILVDELELVGRLGPLARLKAYRNLAWLLNWGAGMQYPIYTLAAAATRLQDDTWYGGGKDDRTTMPLMADQKFGIEAKRELEMFFDQAIGADSPVIAPADASTLLAMLDALVDIHGTAYDWLPVINTQDLVAELGSQPIRTYVRAALEALDIKYLYNENVKMQATQLSEQSLDEDETFLVFADENC